MVTTVVVEVLTVPRSGVGEAKVAREAEICYATLACITDYDCWRMDRVCESVTLEIIIGNLLKNVDTS